MEKHKINIELTPSLADAYYYRGIILSEMNKHEEAVQELTKAIELNPLHDYAYMERGKALQYILGKDDEILKDFNKCIEINPNNVDFYAARGTYYYTKSMNEEALRDFAKVLELNPNDIEILGFRAELYTEMKKYPEAFLDYHKLSELNPKDAETYFDLAMVFYVMGYGEACIKNLAKAAELDYDYERELEYYTEKLSSNEN